MMDGRRIAEPIRVTEIVGGKYDGDYRVEAECPGCGSPVVHILDAWSYGPTHRVADCGNRCEGGYDVVRPSEGTLGLLNHQHWEPPFRFFEPELPEGVTGLLTDLGGPEVVQ